jgi:Zn-dependent M28 family amino/carboxypeptidase
VVAITLVGALFLIGISIANFATTVSSDIVVMPDSMSRLAIILGICVAPFLVVWFMMFKFSNVKEVVDGANDNLSANMVAMAVVKAMQEDGLALENTEIGVLFTGSEEAGLRGAKAFAKKHKEEMSDVPTAIINLETLRDMKYLGILNKDLNMTVKNDPDVERLVLKAAKNALGIDLPLGKVELGSTDAAAFSQAGMKATTLAAMSHELEDYYHTRRDTWDNMNPEVMANALDICIEAAELFDKYEFNV